MEHYIYLIIKGVGACYLLIDIACLLFGKGKEKRWRFLTPKTAVRVKTVISETVPKTEVYSIVGKSQTVYLEEIPKEKPIKPDFSEDLEKTSSYEEEPDITDEDVDYNPEEEILSEGDRFLPFDVNPDDGEMATGMTYEQLSTALDVVQGKKTDSQDVKNAAHIMFELNGSDVFNFLTAQAENEQIIEKLLKDYLDADGDSLPESVRKKRQEVADFDMDKYV